MLAVSCSCCSVGDPDLYCIYKYVNILVDIFHCFQPHVRTIMWETLLKCNTLKFITFLLWILFRKENQKRGHLRHFYQGTFFILQMSRDDKLLFKCLVFSQTTIIYTHWLLMWQNIQIYACLENFYELRVTKMGWKLKSKLSSTFNNASFFSLLQL